MRFSKIQKKEFVNSDDQLISLTSRIKQHKTPLERALRVPECLVEAAESEGGTWGVTIVTFFCDLSSVYFDFRRFFFRFLFY